ncbi:hypothetical protein PALB_19920 [Pseudoalteromonas luteoviolacea B = ATCC 29581]|nr:hypothetical protein PALB_19920 [Pseudoalteromonas luteoviolacea B = ATCC 29581]
MKQLSYLGAVCLITVGVCAYTASATELALTRYIEKQAFKKTGLEKKLPQLFVIDANDKPIYYQIGSSTDNFAELMINRDMAEDADYTQSSWQLLRQLPEVASVLEETRGQAERIILVTADPNWFDCTACTVQKESLTAYNSVHESNIINFNIR